MSTHSTYKGTFSISCFVPSSPSDPLCEDGKWYNIKSAYDLFNLTTNITGLKIRNSKMDMLPIFPENLLFLSISDCPNLKKIHSFPSGLNRLIIENNSSLESLPDLPKSLLDVYIVRNYSLTLPQSFKYGIRDINIEWQIIKQPIDLPSSLISLKIDQSYLRFMPRGYKFHYLLCKQENKIDKYLSHFRTIHFNDSDNIWRFTLVNNDVYEEFMEDEAVLNDRDFIPLKHMEIVLTDIDALYV